MTTKPTCTEIALVGRRCRNPASIEGRWCWRHAPPAREVMGGPWDGDTLRSWAQTLFVTFDPNRAGRWCGFRDPEDAAEAGEVRGMYRFDVGTRLWRWERAADRPVDAERERRP